MYIPVITPSQNTITISYCQCTDSDATDTITTLWLNFQPILSVHVCACACTVWLSVLLRTNSNMELVLKTVLIVLWFNGILTLAVEGKQFSINIQHHCIVSVFVVVSWRFFCMHRITLLAISVT